MDLLIVSPVGVRRSGNRHTADQWAALFREFGHDALVVHGYAGESADGFIVLHGEKSDGAVDAIRVAHPDRPVVLCTTGTDIYPEPSRRTLQSMRAADRIVALQPRARDRVPADLHDKLRIIVQSAEPPPPGGPELGPFDVCVVGNLRDVKDPMCAAAASRLLPADSKIAVRHAGAILEDGYTDLVARERRENPRYTWLGDLEYHAARQLIAQSRLLVVSSFHEGGARVVGEAVVADTPVLAARNDAARSLLGDDYPGLFEPGATDELAALLRRAETDRVFMDALRERTRERAAQFDPRHERDAWRALLAELYA